MQTSDEELWLHISITLWTYAERFSLPLKKVRRMPRRDRDRYDGSCSNRGKIRITVRRKNGTLLKPWELVDVMAHELAHLPFQDHKKAWFKLYTVLLHAMAHEGVIDKVRVLCKG